MKAILRTVNPTKRFLMLLVVGVVLMSCVAYAQPPANDQCSGAIYLTAGTTYTMNTGSATSTSEPASLCGQTIGQGVWFAFAPSCNGTVTVSTCGSNFDTVLGVYTGSCGSLSLVTCNDQACGAQSSLSFVGSVGTIYTIFVAGWFSSSGDLRVLATNPPPPSNDQCAGAIALTNASTYTMYTTCAATNDGTTTLCGQPAGKGVWFTFTPAAEGTVTVSSCGSNYDTVLQVYYGSCAAPIPLVCNDQACGNQSSLSFACTGGTTYRILAAGWQNSSGTLNIVAAGLPPPSDLCANAYTLTSGVTFTVNTVYATSTNDPPTLCGQPVGKGVWFAFVPSCNGTVTISTCGSGFDTVLGVYTGSCGTLSLVACNDQACGSQSSLSFVGNVGTTYMIFAAGRDGISGELSILATNPPPPSNDQCAGAIALTNASTYSMYTTCAATNDGTTTLCGQPVGKGVWFTFTPAAEGTVTVSSCGSSYDTILQVYSGSCAALTPIVCNDQACGNQSSLSFAGTSGTTYRILAAGRQNGSGTLNIVATVSPPPNDLCANAYTLTSGTTFTVNTQYATSTSDPTPTCAPGFGRGVWFTFTPTCTDTVTIDACGSDFDTVLQIYWGPCGALTPRMCRDQDCGDQSKAVFSGIEGETYYILAGGWNNAAGTLRIVASQSPPPPNDQCSDALALTDGVSYIRNVSCATSTGDPLPECDPGGVLSRGAWFTYTATCNGTVTVSTCLSGDTAAKVAVYTGTCDNLTFRGIGCNNCGGMGSPGLVRFTAVAGTTYRILAQATNGSLQILVTIDPGAAALSNDRCDSGTAPTLLDGQTYTMSTVCATTQGDPNPWCMPNFGKGVWFALPQVTCDGTFTIKTDGSSFPAGIAVYTGSGCALTQVACSSQSSLSFSASQGISYRVLAGGRDNESGTLHIVAGLAASPSTPPNDLCSGAVTLTTGVTYTMATACATTFGDPTPSCASGFGKGVWFIFDPCRSGTVTVSTCGSDFDTALAVYTGSCGSLTQIACSNDGCGLGGSRGQVSFYASSSAIYRILVGGNVGSGGAGTLRIVVTSFASVGGFDTCQNAYARQTGGFIGTCTEGATSETDPVPSCQPDSGNGVWSSYTPCASGTVTVITCNSNYDTVVAVYTGECGSLTEIACNDDACGAGGKRARASFNGTAGVTYRILVNGRGGASGNLVYSVDIATIDPPPANNQCAGAVALTTGSTYTMCTLAATATNDPSLSCSTYFGRGVWFTYTPCTSGTVILDTCGSNYDTVLTVYTGSCGSLTEIACNDDACGQCASLSFSGTAGTTYRILVGGWNGITYPSCGGTLCILAKLSPAFPELAVHSLALNKTAFMPGELGTATVTIKNSGCSSTGVGYSVNWFRHAPNSAGCGTTTGLYKIVSRPALTAGATDTFSFTFANFSAPGTFTGRLFVDGNCTITESNETNNQATVSYSVLGPDLVVQSLVLNKGTYTPKEIGSVTVTILNQGGTGTGAGYTVDLFRHAPRLVGCGTTTYYKRVSRPALAAGGSETFVIPFVHYAADGIYTLRVFAESGCELAEANEVNNQATATYTVSGGPPDLVLQSVVLNKTNFAAGEVGSATVTIVNQGSGSTLGGFDVDLFRHAPGAVGCNDSTRYKRVSRPALAAGASSTFVVPYKNYTGAGNFVLRVFADGACIVPETSEVNNQATASYTVGVGGAIITNDGTPTEP